MLTDFDIPGIPPPLVELLLKLENPPADLPKPISEKKGSLANMEEPKPKPPKVPNPELPLFFPFRFPKKLLKNGSSSNS